MTKMKFLPTSIILVLLIAVLLEVSMPLKASDHMREAEESAASCAERASRTDDPNSKAEWLALEAKWRRIGHFYAFVESAQRFMEDGARMTQQRLEKAGLDGTILLAPPDQPA